MTTCPFDLTNIHPSWFECMNKALASLDNQYLAKLSERNDWLPGRERIFSAFSLPMEKVEYVLFGESPYPRKESANGYAFWDAAVKELWTETGLSTRVNRATSLRNLIKMLLVAEGSLQPENLSQQRIAEIDKTEFVQTNDEFFANFIRHGFLLLNATPVLRTEGSPQQDAKAWAPFVYQLLTCLHEISPKVKFILLGRIANEIDKVIPMEAKERLYAEHPYNHSFITNPEVIAFFKPLHLLRK